MKCGGGPFHSIFNSLYMLYGNLKLYFVDRPKRRKINRHNYTTIKHVIDYSRINVGNYTYGELDIRFGPKYNNSYIYMKLLFNSRGCYLSLLRGS